MEQTIIELLETLHFESEEIKNWFYSVYKNHYTRLNTLPSIEEILHIQDFLNSSHSPSILIGKTFGNIKKSMEVWEKTQEKIDNLALVEKTVDKIGEYEIVKLLSRASLIQEGVLMDHCIGKSSTYTEGLKNGKSLNFSLRKKGERVATFEIKDQKELHQIKGPRNMDIPTEEVQIIIDFCNKMGYTEVFTYFSYPLIQVGDRIVFFKDIQDLLKTVDYVPVLKLRKMHGIVIIPSTVSIGKLDIDNEALVFFDKELHVKEFTYWGNNQPVFLPEKIFADRVNFYKIHFEASKTEWHCPRISFSSCKIGTFPSGKYKHIDIYGQESGPIKFEGNYFITDFKLNDTLITGNYEVTCLNFSNTNSILASSKIKTIRQLYLSKHNLYKADFPYERLYLNKIQSIKSFSQKSIYNLEIHQCGIKFIPLERVRGNLTLVQLKEIELNYFLTVCGDMTIRESDVVLPKKLVVEGNLRLERCKIQKWPEEMEIFGCLIVEGEGYPQIPSSTIIHQEKDLFHSNLDE